MINPHLTPVQFPRYSSCGGCAEGNKTDAELAECVHPCFNLSYLLELRCGFREFRVGGFEDDLRLRPSDGFLGKEKPPSLLVVSVFFSEFRV